MQNDGRLYSQVAAEAGVAIERAMVACYLLNLSKEGKTLDEAADLIRKPRCEAREYARDWGIRFPDYVAADAPLALTWLKPRRGLWELRHAGSLIAQADADGEGGYVAHSGALQMKRAGSSAEIAIRRLSAEMERAAVDVFGVDDVVMTMLDPSCGAVQVCPKPIENAAQLRQALAS